jgi:NAD(P)-dependent dehydrogenase (short-subunit alcohol dehydrogenase family)
MYAKEDIRAIVLVDKNETGLARVEQELKAEHPSLRQIPLFARLLKSNTLAVTLTISADLTKEDEVQAVFAQAVAKFQRIDYAVCQSIDA